MLPFSLTANKTHLPSLLTAAAAFALAAALLTPVDSIQAKEVEVHDPVMTQVGNTYYAFSTGPGITYYSSTDKVHWKHVGRVFADEPSWARKIAPGFNGHLWAPDIYQKNGLFYLYYSVSAFGKNTSGIGVAVNSTLDPADDNYQWVDQGPILQSIPNRDNWNAIDPAIIEDEQGNAWMSFGSFWDGLKLVKLDDDMVRLAEPQEWHTIAKRERSADQADADPGDAAIEAPYIFHKNGYYYLFVSFDKCCRGMNSTYNVRVGRAKTITGPYLDRNGKSMLDGGGSLVIGGNKNWVALGHNAAYTFDGKDYLVLHAYETADNALQKLRILPIQWQQGWPIVNPGDLDTLTTQLMEDK